MTARRLFVGILAFIAAIALTNCQEQQIDFNIPSPTLTYTPIAPGPTRAVSNPPSPLPLPRTPTNMPGCAFAWVMPSAGHQSAVRVSGDTVVWVQEEPGAAPGTTGRVWIKSLSTGRAFPISTTPGIQDSPDVSGDVVVWADTRNSCPTCDRDIYGYRLSTGQEFPIAVGPGDQNNPAVSGSVVVWQEVAEDQTSRIRGVDLASGQALEIAPPLTGTHAFYGRPAIDGPIVVYAEVHGNPKDVAHYSHVIYAYNLKTGVRTPVAQVNWPTSYYAVSGSRVAWAAGMVHVFDLTTGRDTPLPSQPYSSMVDIDGDVVVWSENVPGEARHRLAGYDLAGEVSFLISDAPSDQVGPSISGTTVVWISTPPDGVPNVAMCRLSRDLPPVP